MSIGGLVSQLLLRRRAPSLPLFPPGWLTTYRSLRGDVSWSLVGTLASHVRSRSYIYIATSLAGLAAMATLNIGNLLFRPLSLLLTAWSNSALPRLAGLAADGEAAAFHRILRRAMAAAIAGSVLWFALLLLAWEPLSRYLLAGKYPDARAILLPCAVASAIWLVHSVASVGLVAAREFKFLAYADLGCAAISAVATTGMMLWQGYRGAMWGVALGYGVALVLETAKLTRIQRMPRTAAQRTGVAASASATAK
jgi:O-antigen/teichoic acid export membrane protein